MNRGRMIGSLVLVAVVVAAIVAWMAGLGARPRLGLDLRGGISVILTPVAIEGVDVPVDVIDQTIEIIRSRVDSLGVAEPEIARQGGDILVQLPGLEDRDRALEVIGKTAQLTMRPVQELLIPGTPQYDAVDLDCGGTVPEPAEVPTDTVSVDPGATESPAAEPTGGEGSPTDEVSPAEPDATASPAAAPATDDEVRAAAQEPVTPITPVPGPGAGAATPPTAVPPGSGDLNEDQTAVLCGVATDDPETPDEDESELAPPKYVVGPAALTGTGVEDARAVLQTTAQGAVTNDWIVQLDLTGEGGDAFAQITGQLACERDQGSPGGGQLAVVLDEQVESAPAMNPEVQCGVGITGGQAVITVGGIEEEARDLALVLRTGALPITLEPSTAFNVSPTLGAGSLRAGIIAGLVGLGLVAIWLISFYRWLGVIAFVGLFTFGVMILGLITLLGEAGFTLTLAGIAGVIVSIGVAADSSILYFERIRDELSTGKTVRTSVVRAFGPAFRTNLTGNTVTIAAAVVLYFLAVGPVRGFAFTLGLSTALDLVILFVFTRPAVQLLGQGRLLSRRSLRMAAVQPAGGSR